MQHAMSNNANRILVGTDFSTPALAAVRRAGRLASAGGAELELMHVISPRDVRMYRAPGGEANRRRVVAEAMSKLRSLASEAAARLNVSVAVHVQIGSPHAELASRADATAARLVVVGPHGGRPVRDLFIGSTAGRLRRVLRAPLLIARNRAARTHERALIAVDFSAASVAAAHAAASLFPEAELHFLHVPIALFDGHLSRAGVSAGAIRTYRNQVLLEASRDLARFIRSNGLQSRRASSLVKLGYVPACVRETAAERGASIVVLGDSNKSWLEAGVTGSVSEELLTSTLHDVLLAKAIQPPVENAHGDRLRRSDMELETVEA